MNKIYQEGPFGPIYPQFERKPKKAIKQWILTAFDISKNPHQNKQ